MYTVAIWSGAVGVPVIESRDMDQSTSAKINLLLRQYALLMDEGADVLRMVRDEENMRIRNDALDLLKGIDTRRLVLLDQIGELLRSD